MNPVTMEQISDAFLELDKNVEMLEQCWNEILPELPQPPRSQFKRWLRLSNGDVTRYIYAFERAGLKQRTAGAQFRDPLDHPVRWISCVANNYRREHAV